MLRSLVSGVALAAAALTLGATAAQSQTRQYDGYCYVRPDDMATNAATAPCLNGEYYAYTDSYRAAPRAPDGYQVEYFTRRPSHDVYSEVYNASTLTENFDPGASNHFGAGDGGYAYNGDNGYRDDRDRPYDPQYAQHTQDYDQDVQPGAVNGDRVAGWRDDRGEWHVGQPTAFGWRDDSGRWHVGQLSAYGWQDDQGEWHAQAPDSGGGY